MGKKDFKDALCRLIQDGQRLINVLRDLTRLEFGAEYQKWYTRALGAARSLLPDRLNEFVTLYRDEDRRSLEAHTFGIKDYIEDVSSFSASWTKNAAITKLGQQIHILASAESRLDDILADVRGVLQADLFDSEIDAARDLLKAGHLRPAGAVVRVVIEGHLKEICAFRELNIRKKKPVISDYNSALKEAGILDLPNWRWIQRLADLGNLCCHQKDREPTKDEVAELIDGAEKVVKTVS